MDDVKVSIITPSYNQALYLEETILSVLAQTYSNIEYIVIDGGSTDGSVEIIQRYAHRIDYWCSEKDAGQADAINKGFQHATGDLICWINSDDILYATFVEERVQQFKQHPDIDMIYGDVEQGVDLNHKKVRYGAKTGYEEMLLTLNVPIPQQSAMWRKTIVEQVGYLQPQWYVLLDREFFMRIAEKGHILYVPGALAFFRNHEQSKSIKDWGRWAGELEIYYLQLFAVPNTRYYHLRQRALTIMYLHCYQITRDCRMKNEWLRYFKLALRQNPTKTIYTVIMDELCRVKRSLRFKVDYA